MLSVALLVALSSAPGFTFHVPKLVDTLDVPGETWAAGTPVSLRIYRSREKPENILRDFVQAARQQNLFIPPPSAQSQDLFASQLTALDPEAMLSYTLILQPEPDDTVGVILAVADLGRKQQQPTEHTFPTPPGASAPLVARMEGHEVVSFDVPQQLDAVSFYRSVLTKSGYTEPESGVFRRGGEQLLVRETPTAAAGRKGVVLTRQGAPSP